MFFELEDVKRRHNPQWWSNNVTAWHTAIDSTPSWNYQRGAFIGLASCALQGYIDTLAFHYKSMLRVYQPPVNLKQSRIFWNQLKKLDGYSSHLKNKMQFAISDGLFGTGVLYAAFRTFNSGWSNNFGGVQWSFYRKFPSFLAAAIVASPVGVALEMAQRAYYADKTFPKQLSKNYKSFWNACARIPFQQGPYYLFKNTFPLFFKHIMGPFIYLTFYDWFIDKLSIFWRTSNMPILPIQLLTATLSVWAAAGVTYPFVKFSEYLVDFHPKVSGSNAFEGNYRKAAVYIYFAGNMNNFMPGFFKTYFWKVAPQWFTSLLIADRLGLFRYWRIDIFSGAADNSNEDSFI